jgi:hypothetical protein
MHQYVLYYSKTHIKTFKNLPTRFDLSIIIREHMPFLAEVCNMLKLSVKHFVKVVWQHIVLMHVVLITGRQIDCHTTLTKCFTDYFNILHTSARNYMCSLIMIVDRNMQELFKCFNVCFRIIQYILVHLLVLIISNKQN